MLLITVFIILAFLCAAPLKRSIMKRALPFCGYEMRLTLYTRQKEPLVSVSRVDQPVSTLNGDEPEAEPSQPVTVLQRWWLSGYVC